MHTVSIDVIKKNSLNTRIIMERMENVDKDI